MREVHKVFRQEMHCCGPTGEDDATIKIEYNDGGGGEYVVLNVRHWAFEKEEEVDEMATEIKKMITAAKVKS